MGSKQPAHNGLIDPVPLQWVGQVGCIAGEEVAVSAV